MKIQVNRNSWHGKVTRYLFGDDHIKNLTSFCPYFWSIWIACALSPVRFTTLFLESHGQLGRVGLMIGLILLSLGVVYQPDVTIVSMMIVIGFSSGGLLLYWILEAWEPEYVERKTTHVKPEEKQPSVIVTFLKSKKDKVCPMMEEVNI